MPPDGAARDGTNTLLEVSGLTKRFGGFTAVNDVDFRLEKGEILGLIGPNGSGKSTIFNMLAGLLRPNAGSIVLEGREIRRVGSSRPIRVDVRVIAATHRDLRREINDGSFRPDLYYRLAVVRVHMPALRQRPEDIPIIARHLLRGLGARDDQVETFSTGEVLGQLRRADWPGDP